MYTSSNLLPGMVDENVEIFVEKNDVKALMNGKVIPFAQLPFATIALLKEEMYKDNDVLISLFDMHPTSEMKRIEQFAKCRLGGLDFAPDIENGTLQDGEFWNCPNRGTCPHEGILCKLPIVNGKRLEKKEVQILQLTSTEMTNDVIAETLDVSLGLLHKLKKNMYAALRIQTKQEGTLLAKFFNII